MVSPNIKHTDQELIALLKAGDREAFAKIYKRYWTVMYMHALRMLKSEDDARDVVQEVFTALWLKCQALVSDVNLAGYLYTATKNKVLDLIAQKRVRINYLDSLASFIEVQSNRILDAITEKEMMQALEKEIQQLPPKMKQIFEMRVKQHLTYKEIANELEISDKTVKKQISNAIHIIRPKLHHVSGWLAFIILLNK
jgi:RNA polymerase sigma-70 factor (ECF subfamily)